MGIFLSIDRWVSSIEIFNKLIKNFKEKHLNFRGDYA